jgi:Putative transposase
VKALSPIYRAIFKEDMSQAGLREHIDPQVWHVPWNVHSQAGDNGHTAFQYLAPYVFRVAISNRRLVGLQDRTVTFTYRQPGSARPRTTSLDAMEFIRRFLQHVLPDGFMKVRHFGFLHASCAIPPDTLRRMILQESLTPFKPAQIVPPQPLVTCCPTCGVQMRLVMRLWTADRTFVDTS